MNFKALESQRKLTGSYYTPQTMASFVSKWIMESSPRKILEPSCGDGAFFSEINQIARLQGRNDTEVFGVDFDEKVIADLKSRKKKNEFDALDLKLVHNDFLDYSIEAISKKIKFDAVIGNPPFIRYQYLDEAHQSLTEKIFSDSNLKFTKHTNAWVPFVIQSINLLNEGGRLGMVIPTEIMHVLHANSLRQFLIETCQKIAVVHIEDLFSSEVLQGVVLLLCEKKSANFKGTAQIAFPTASRFNLYNGHVYEFIKTINYKKSDNLDYKWTEGLLTTEEEHVYQKAKTLKDAKIFSDLADADVGIVTGANDFFLVPDSTVKRYALQKFSKPMFGRSSHVRGVIFSENDAEENRDNGLPVNFIEFPATQKTSFGKKVQEYLELGESQELHKRYKCRIRSPWYVVPSVWASEVSMLKRAHDLPRLIYNQANSYTTDTAYRITTKPKVKAERLVWSFINSLTALSSELESRHYGGGVIELVPSEIERLVVPYVEMPKNALARLDKSYREQKSAEDILKEQDQVVLKTLGLNEKEIDILHKAWLRLKNRRQRKD